MEESELNGMLNGIETTKKNCIKKLVVFMDNVNFVRKITTKEATVDWKLQPILDRTWDYISF